MLSLVVNTNYAFCKYFTNLLTFIKMCVWGGYMYFFMKRWSLPLSRIGSILASRATSRWSVVRSAAVTTTHETVNKIAAEYNVGSIIRHYLNSSCVSSVEGWV